MYILRIIAWWSSCCYCCCCWLLLKSCFAYANKPWRAGNAVTSAGYGGQRWRRGCTQWATGRGQAVLTVAHVSATRWRISSAQIVVVIVVAVCYVVNRWRRCCCSCCCCTTRRSCCCCCYCRSVAVVVVVVVWNRFEENLKEITTKHLWGHLS